MIEFISEWAGQLVVALIIGSLIEMIIPKGKNKKYVKMLIGMYIIFCMISPFMEINETFSMEDIGNVIESYGKQTEEVVDQTSMDVRLEDLYIDELEKNIKEDVEAIGYKVTKCKVEAVLKANDENAGIKKISIKVKKYTDEIAEAKEQNAETSEIEKIENIEISINEEKKENTTNIVKDDVKKIKKLISEKYEIEENKVHIS